MTGVGPTRVSTARVTGHDNPHPAEIQTDLARYVKPQKGNEGSSDVEHEALSTAVQHAIARPLAGAEALERRRTTVDASPMTAAELAVWALLRRPPSRPVFAA